MGRRTQKAPKVSRPAPATSLRRAPETARNGPDEPLRRTTDAGNLQVMESLGMRAKLPVSMPGDADEIEADRVADAFVSGDRLPGMRAERGTPWQRACMGCEELSVRRSAEPGGSPAPATGGRVGEAVTRAMRASQGETMPERLRSEFAGFFGDNLANVRLHSGSAARSAASMLSAQAFTRGNDIYFNQGRLSPESAQGRRLLAHEIAHVMQGDGVDAVARRWPEQPEVCPAAPRLLDGMPWLYRGTGDESVDSLELYGIDLSGVPAFNPPATGLVGLLTSDETRHIAYPELLTDEYRCEFHGAMGRLLDDDVSRAESLLLQSSLGSGEVSTLLDMARFWASKADVRLEEADRSYFDEFLARLASARLVEQGVFGDETRSFLDELYNVVEDDVAELNTLIAQRSVVYGGYRPVWSLFAPDGTLRVPAAPDLEFVTRTAEIVLERLRDATTGTDSRVITDVLVGLTPDLQRAVLRQIMSRYDETDWTGFFGRHGEAWQEGMLYWLYEDLTEEDRVRLSESFNQAGVLPEETTRILEGGRGAGQYLPFTTRKGQEAAEFWADLAVENEGTPAGYAAVVPGLFASLWLPETASSTIITLGTAGVAPPVAQAFPALGRGMLVVGTGLTAYGTTIAAQELMTGRDVYTGRPLDEGEVIARALQVVSGLLSLGTGFWQGARLSLGGTAPASRIGMRLLSVEGDEVTVLGYDPVSNQYAIVRLNVRTGMGTATNATTGETVPISNMRLDGAHGGLLTPGGPVDAEVVVPGGGAGGSTLVPTITEPPVLPAPPPTGPVVGPPLLGSGTGPGHGFPRLALPAGAVPDADFGASLQAALDAELGVGESPVIWSVTPDGIAFATPIEGLPIYTPEGLLPPGEWLAGAPRVETLTGPLIEGFAPFDVFSPPIVPSRSLGAVRGTRGGNVVRGAAGRDLVAELHGGDTEVTLTLPGGMTRRADLLAPAGPGTLNTEVKTYLRYLRNATGVTVVNEVPLSEFIRTEITRDAMIMYYYPEHQSVWVFVDAPPSAALAEALTAARIPYIVYSDRVPFAR